MYLNQTIMSQKRKKVSIAVKIVILTTFCVGVVFILRGLLLNDSLPSTKIQLQKEFKLNDPISLLEIPERLVSSSTIKLPNSSQEFSVANSIWISFESSNSTSVGILSGSEYAEIYLLPSNSKIFRVYQDKSILFENDNDLYLLTSNSEVSKIYSSDFKIFDAIYISTTKSFLILTENSGEYKFEELKSDGKVIASFSTTIQSFLSSQLLGYENEKIYLAVLDSNFSCLEYDTITRSEESLSCLSLAKKTFTYTPDFPSYIISSIYYVNERWYINTSQSLILDVNSKLTTNFIKADRFFGYDEGYVYFAQEDSLYRANIESFPTSFALEEAEVVLQSVNNVNVIGGIYLL